MKVQGYTIIPDEFLDLGLSIYETLALSVIYGFSQDAQSLYTGGLRYLAKKCMCSVDTARRALRVLEDKGLIKRYTRTWNDITLYDFRAMVVYKGGGSRVQGGVAECKGVVAECHPKNKNINIYNSLSNAHAREAKTFRKPTADEVAEYCKARGNSIDPQGFVDHYESNGWLVGRNPMKDWKAAVRTWERHQPSFAPAQGGGSRPRRTRTEESFHDMMDYSRELGEQLQKMGGNNK